MYLSEAVDEIREKLVKHRLAPRKFLWRTILMQIKKAGYFDGHLENPILEGVEAGRRVSVFEMDPGTGERLGLLATVAVGEGGWVDLREPIMVRAGDAFIAISEQVE